MCVFDSTLQTYKRFNTKQIFTKENCIFFLNLLKISEKNLVLGVWFGFGSLGCIGLVVNLRVWCGGLNVLNVNKSISAFVSERWPSLTKCLTISKVQK